MIKEEQLTAYKEMVKNASANGMEAQIRDRSRFGGLFYADEDADDIKPTAKAQKALDAWMEKFKPNWKEVA